MRKLVKSVIQAPYPVLFALSPVLYFFSTNKTELSLTNQEFLAALLISAVLALVLWAAAGLVLKSSSKGAVFTSSFILLFFSYGSVKSLIPEFNIPLPFADIGVDKTLISLSVILLALGGWKLSRIKEPGRQVTKALNITSVVLVFLFLADIIPYKVVSSQQKFEPILATPEDTKLTAETKPDIYYIIFDRYANSETLKTEFGYDNGEFISFLENEGFYVASKSYTNYSKTFLSLASSLNMEHLLYLTKQLGENNSDKTPVYEMLQDHRVQRLLKSLGYKYIHSGDWWGGTAKNKYADENISYSTLESEFALRLFDNTALSPVIQTLGGKSEKEKRKEKILFKIAKILQIPNDPNPTFTFAHILIPHNPYVFNRDGSTLTKEEEVSRTAKENYLNQLIFTNEIVKSLVEGLIQKSSEPPIIVIQSDEGPCAVLKEFKGMCGEKINWNTLPNNVLKAHMRILNAYYLPNSNYENLYPSVTPVNSFRLIFNQYFGTGYELLPDKSFMLPDTEHPYKFIDITEKVKLSD